MIKKILLSKKTLHFRGTFKIAYEEVVQEDLLFLQIIDEQGRVGIGSASFDKEVSRETASDLLKILRSELKLNFFDQPLEHWYYYHKKIEDKFGRWPAAQTMIETAVLNLWSFRHRLSLWDFFGANRSNCHLGFTVCIKDLSQTLTDVRMLLKEGYRVIKLKGGLNWQEDAQKVLKVSALLPNGIELLFDANQGYSFLEASNFLKKVKNSRLSLLEQPVAAKNLVALKKLHKISTVPIFADEAAVSLEDCRKLLLEDYVAGVNVKLMKCGGPINFLNIYNLAKSLNKKVMIGCMYESLASLTMSGQLALGLPVDYVDLDSGPIDFYDDPARGGLIFKNGQLYSGGRVRLEL